VRQLKVDNADLSLQPQSGSILQPKVAVAATLGSEDSQLAHWRKSFILPLSMDSM